MSQDKKTPDRHQLEQAIAAQETLRGVLDDAIIDATLAALHKQLAELDEDQEERKLITVLFMDIAGSTSIVRDLDPEDNMQIMDTALRKLATVITNHGGEVTRFTGDGFIAMFGTDVSQENDPEMAVRAGLAMLAAAEAYEQEVNSAWGIPNFDLRIGINTGLILLGGVSEAAGAAVNLTARLESAALPGTVLISHDTYAHVKEIFDVIPQAPIAAKGFAESIPVYQVLRPKRRTFRSHRGSLGAHTPLIGRSAELQTLQAAYTTAAAGESQLVTVIGEAGLGKSRLLYAFEDWLAAHPQEMQVFKTRARPETRGTPYGLLRTLFTFQFDILDDEPTIEMQGKLESGIQSTLPIQHLGEMKTHFIGQLLGFNFRRSPHLRGTLENPQELRDRARQYLLEYLRLMVANNPVVFLLDDLHWADDSSLEVLGQFVRQLAKHPFLVVTTARPEFLEQPRQWNIDGVRQQQLTLHALSVQESLQLVAELLQHIPEIPTALENLIMDHTGGNPFYAEEMVKMLIDHEVITPFKDTWQISMENLTAAVVPPTLAGILQARLDRMPPHDRLILQQASVVGRVFWNRVLRFLNQTYLLQETLDIEVVDHSLQSLVDKEMVFEREKSEFLASKEFSFKHAILREVSYERVLKKHRRIYHLLAADWLIENRGNQENVFLGQIAHHLEKAEDHERAAAYLLRAGQFAAQQYANEEALVYFARGLTAVPSSNLDTRYRLHLAREQVYDLLGQREAQAADLAALESIALTLKEPEKQAETALRRANFADLTSDYGAAQTAAKQAVYWAQFARNKSQEAAGYLAWGKALWRQAAYNDAYKQLAQALQLAQAAGLPRLVGSTLRILGLVADEQGNYHSSRDYLNQALAIFNKIGDQKGESQVLNNLGSMDFHKGDHLSAQDYYTQSLEKSRNMGNRQGESQALGNLGLVAYYQSDYPLAHQCAEQALEIFISIGDQLGESQALNNLGVFSGDLGRYSEARDYHNRVLLICKTIDDRQGESRALLNLGNIANAQGDFSAAQAFAEQSLEIRREIGQQISIASALFVLGNALIGLGRWQEARAAIQEAKTLREKLELNHMAMETHAGLIQIALGEGSQSEALYHADQIIAYLQSGNSLGGTEVIWIYTKLVQALKSNNDPRKTDVLYEAYHLLQDQADQIPNLESRTAFLENVPWNREIAALWEGRQDP